MHFMVIYFCYNLFGVKVSVGRNTPAKEEAILLFMLSKDTLSIFLCSLLKTSSLWIRITQSVFLEMIKCESYINVKKR